MSSFDILTISSGKEKRSPSGDMNIDFASVRIGADNLPIAQGGSGAGAYFDLGAKAVRSSFDASNDNDLVNLSKLNEAISSLASGTEWQDSVLTRAASPAGGETVGDRYLVIAAGSDDITGVNTGTKTFTVAGDQEANYSVGDIIKIKNSTGNNGYYTVVSATFDTDHTDIVVEEVISDATVDGVIRYASGDFSAIGVDKIATKTSSGWSETVPTTGMAVLVDDEPSKMYVYGTISWGSKSFETTTASGFLDNTDGDITLKNLTDGKIIIGDVSNVAQAVTLSGDVTVSNAGVTAIGTNKVIETMINDGAVTVNKLGAAAVTKAKINADVAGVGLRQNVDGSLERNDAKTLTNDNAGSITVRQIVYVKSNGHVDLAEANVADLWKSAICIVEAASIATTEAGLVTVRKGAIVGGFSGLTPGKVYVSPSTAGGYTQDPVTDFEAGDDLVSIGEAISATEIMLGSEFHWEY